MKENDQTFIVSKTITAAIKTQAGDESPPSSNPSGHLPRGTQLEGFEITELLGVGGFGLVYKAWDPTLEREVAIKEYLPESLAYRDAHGLVRLKKEGYKETFDAGMRSFVNEAKLLARFDHPALIKVFRFWESQGTAYMVMPYYKGKTLKARQTDIESPIDERLLLDMILPMCDALHIMHQQHCIHRDVSPDNVIVEEATGKPILLDFGAARRAIGQCGQSFTVILKSGYAPIEQYAEIPHYQQGPWTDVYALAALAHYLIRGKAPSPAVGRMVHDSHRPLSDDSTLPYPKHILLALDWGLQIEPDKRPQSMLEFRTALLGLSFTGADTSEGAARLSVLDSLLSDSDSTQQEKSLEGNSHTPKPLSRLTANQWMKWIGVVLIPIACLVYALFADEFAHEFGKQPSQELQREIQSETLQHTKQETKPEPTALGTQTPAPNHQTQNPFEQILQSSNPSWALSVESPRTTLRINRDLLQLNITSTQEGYLTVWVESAGGTVEELPVGTPFKPVKLKAGAAIQIPDISQPLLAGGPAGKNRILVLVSEKPLDRGAKAPPDNQSLGSMNYGATLVEIEQIEGFE